jgi:hypothetical protein
MTDRTDNCATGFSEIFAEKSFLYKNIDRTGWLNRPDGRMSAASNFHNRIRASGSRGRSVRTAKNFSMQFPYLMRVRPDHKGETSGRLNFSMQFPYLMRMRPDHKGETSGRLKSNRQLPYTMHQRPDHSCQMSERFILNCDSCLTEIRVRTVYHIVRTVD